MKKMTEKSDTKPDLKPDADAVIAVLWFCRDLTDPKSYHVPAGVIAAMPVLAEADIMSDAADWTFTSWLVPAHVLGLAEVALQHLWTKLPVLMARLARAAIQLGVGSVANAWMETFSGDQSSIVVVASIEHVDSGMLRAVAAKTLAACAQKEAEVQDDPVYRVVDRLTEQTQGWCEASLAEAAGSEGWKDADVEVAADDDDIIDIDCDHRERDSYGECIECGSPLPADADDE